MQYDLLHMSKDFVSRSSAIVAPSAPLVAMITATALWGTSGGVIAGLDINGFAAAAVVELVTGIVLVALGIAQGHRVERTIAALGRFLPLLAVIEAGNVALYYVALQVGPVGPVIAVHLTAPVILTLIDMARGRRRLTSSRAATFVLIIAALAMIATTGPADGRDHAMVGLALSLASAGCLAAFITIVRKVADRTPATLGAGIQMLCSGLLLSPALIALDGDRGDLATLVLTAVILFAPACLLYWRALRTLSAITAGSIQLGEPFFGAAAAVLLYELRPTRYELLSVALVIAAVFLEINKTQPDVPKPRPEPQPS
jgi:drug/metabolite transporter (DMT)-like permease